MTTIPETPATRTGGLFAVLGGLAWQQARTLFRPREGFRAEMEAVQQANGLGPVAPEDLARFARLSRLVALMNLTCLVGVPAVAVGVAVRSAIGRDQELGVVVVWGIMAAVLGVCAGLVTLTLICKVWAKSPPQAG